MRNAARTNVKKQDEVKKITERKVKDDEDRLINCFKWRQLCSPRSYEGIKHHNIEHEYFCE